ncbi:MAG: DNA helicase rad5 [Claussenomyces sp. TS43310]|nr:MAG: DNA helicase rad5 [Claussenomyces sp. TS43310]
MSYAEIEEPPAKRRRFFTEKGDSSKKHETLLPDEHGTTTEQSPSYHEVDLDLDRHGGHATSDDCRKLPQVSEGFDQETFESFIGDKMARSSMQLLREASGNNIERAVNMYLDGSWTSVESAVDPGNNGSPSSDSLVVCTFGRSGASNERVAEAAPSTTSKPSLRKTGHSKVPESRYIGAFGVGGWTTRSGFNLINHGETVRIERQKIQPPKPSVARGSKLKPNAPPITSKPSSNAVRRVDVVVRFTNSRGDEVGRLPQETANWVSTLMDQHVCKFEGSCVFAPDKIRINDTVFLQIQCSLLKTAFDNRGFKPAENRASGMFDEKETAEEKDLRLRQIALVKLFEEINLLPSRSSETTAKHKRQGLLEAAEVAERHDKGDAKVVRLNIAENGLSSPSSEDAEDGKELEQDQLDALYKKSQSFDFDAPQAEPSNTFAMDLRPYQKQALHWMKEKEMAKKNEGNETSMHPLWEEYPWPTKDMNEKELPQVGGQNTFYVNPYSGELSLDFPIQEQHCLGGILADEMGLGKTIEMMSLIHSHKSMIADRLRESPPGTATVNDLPRLSTHESHVERAPCTTLVVAPMSLLAQWQSEAERASKEGTLKSMIYYGNEKTANLRNLCCEANAASAPDIIVTSYGVVLSEFNQVAARKGDRGSHGGLFSLNYFRVILDEAHHIKNRQSKTAKACYEIDAEHRWVLTGTPIVNRLEDLFSLVRFLRVEPWSNFSFWKTFITVPFESQDFMRALDVVQTVLEPLVLRRTKDMRTPTGEALVPLPPKTVDIIKIELSQPEREVYEHIFKRAKRTFKANVDAGTVMKAYTSIFAQILRLRQSCCHPTLTRNQSFVTDEEDVAEAADAASGLADDMDLQSLIERFTATTSDETDANAFGAHVLEQIRDEAGNECPICSEEPMIEQTVTACWHSACRGCLMDYISRQINKGEPPKCFNCRTVISLRDLFEVVKHDDEVTKGSVNPRISLQRVGSNSSAKIGALLSHLKTLKKEIPGTKSVVFSQFTSFLSLIEPALTRASIPFLRLDGSMSQRSRVAVLTEFSASKRGTVLLLSLRAGGVGLNLTVAKRVYLMDPWWSFAVEAQAIDRVHRMGQSDEVKVCRFIIKESVEERMLRIQDRKKFIASSLGMMSDEEKKLQRIEDIKELLS